MTDPLLVPAESARTHRIPELDGLRAFSVALVIIFHSWAYALTIPAPASLDWLMKALGLMGVKIFFTISGFIITRLMLEEVAATGRFSARNFYIKRAFRILPAYWTYLAIVSLLVALGVIYSDAINLVLSLLFVSNFFQWGHGLFYNHTWSLSVEEQYYLLFPPMVALLLRKGVRFTVVLLVALHVLLVFAPNLGKVMRVHWHVVDIAPIAFFRYIIDGALLALWLDSYRNWVRRTSHFAVLSLIGILIGSLFIVDHLPPSLEFFLKYADMLVEPVLIAAIMGWILCRPQHFGLLRWTPMQWLGRISYSIYLWQQLFTIKPNLYLKVPHPPLWAAVPLILLCATASFYFIERPSNAFGRRLVKKNSADENGVKVELSRPHAEMR